MELSVQEIAALLNGEVEGDGTLKISKIAKIQEGEEGAISFLANQKYEEFIYTTQASVVLVNNDFTPKQTIHTTLIRVEDAYSSFSILLEEYNRFMNFQKQGIENPSYISKTAQVGEGIYVGAFAYIGENCQIGNNCKIYPHAYIGDNSVIGDNTIIHSGVKIYANTQIGSYCTFHSGVVIGSDGFGFAPQKDGTYKTIPQVGNVIIKDHVDIGGNTVIDCATMGSTIIESGTKLDNLVQIAHNVKLGKNTVIASQAGISGSSTLGDNCVIAGQVGVIGHLEVPARTTVAAQSGVMRTYGEGATLMGSPAFEHKEHLKSLIVYRKLPALKKQVEQLERRLLKFENQAQSK